jgi:hypothetical protein
MINKNLYNTLEIPGSFLVPGCDIYKSIIELVNNGLALSLSKGEL